MTQEQYTARDEAREKYVAQVQQWCRHYDNQERILSFTPPKKEVQPRVEWSQ